MSKTINIPLGSQHIALLEPVHFTFECENEQIIGATADVGYVHRGVELACSSKFRFKQVGYVVSRVCGLCAVIHASCYTLAVEQVMGIEATKRAQWLRILSNELDRVHSHLLCLAHTAENAGFEALFMQTMKDRELVMEAQEALCGNRVQFDFVTIGGVNRDVDSQMVKILYDKLDKLEQKIDNIFSLFTTNPSLSLKYKGIGAITKEKAELFSTIGPIARASGLAMDVRSDSNYLPYSEVGFKIILEESGDIHARNLIRLKEIKNSLLMARNILDGLPEGEIMVKVSGAPDGEGYMRVEAPRGECFYYVKGVKSQTLDRVKIKTPTFACIPAMIDTFIGSNYADAPAILASFDPCMSCTAK
jgi:ech hydrogenase subunit E